MPTETIYHPPNLQIQRKIDEGRYGAVFQAVGEGGRLFAIKRIIKYATVMKKATAYARKICREVAILKTLTDANVDFVIPLNMVYLSEDKQDVYLVMPMIPFTLDYVINGYVLLDEPQIKSIAYQILAGIRDCHRRNFLHRDLTLKNILVDDDSNVYVADFGLSRAKDSVEEEGTIDVVTLEYRPPELLLCYKKYDARVDIWSIGCIIAEMYLRRRLLAPETRDEPHQVRKIIQLLGTPDFDAVEEYAGITAGADFVREVCNILRDEGLLEEPFKSTGEALKAAGASPEAIDLIKGMLQFDFRNRPTSDQALNHPWFMNDPLYNPPAEDEEGNEQQQQENNNNNDGNDDADAAIVSSDDGGKQQHNEEKEINVNSDAATKVAPNALHQHHHHHHHHHHNVNNNDNKVNNGENPLNSPVVEAPPPADDANATTSATSGEQQERRSRSRSPSRSVDGNNSSSAAAAAASATSSSSNQQQNSNSQNEDAAIFQSVGSVGTNYVERNELLYRLQKAKLSQLKEYMESVAFTDIPLVRGEYQIGGENDGDDAVGGGQGMAVELSNSPTD